MCKWSFKIRNLIFEYKSNINESVIYHVLKLLVYLKIWRKKFLEKKCHSTKINSYNYYTEFK